MTNSKTIVQCSLPDHRKYAHFHAPSLYTQTSPVHWCRSRRLCPV